MAHPVRPDHYIEISNFYTATVYEKGAEVVRMLHTLLGESKFRQGMDLYFERHDGEAVTVEVFVACMAEVSGRDLTPFMLWYRQPGTPRLQWSWRQDLTQGWVELTLRQDLPAALEDSGAEDWQPPPIPVLVGLISRNGGEELLPEKSRLLELTALESRFRFDGIDVPVIPSVLRNFSAPVLLEGPLTREERLFLMTHDSDPFNRWDAGQQVAEELLLEGVAHHLAGESWMADRRWLEGMAEVLQRAPQDPRLAAEMLTLPAERWLLERMEVIDIDAIHSVRNRLQITLAEHHQETMVTLYQQTSRDRVAGRMLRNRLLQLLVPLQQESLTALALEQYHQPLNMSEELGALRALARVGGEVREESLQRFYEKWQHHRLVVDKWFALQAASDLPGTLEQVETLLSHPRFEITNPNRVRAVIGTFAHGNLLHFHRGDGAGYRLVADQVLRLDALNPQIAARLAGAFNRWRRLDPGHQQMAQEQLQRMAAAVPLSRDLYEVVARNLEGG